MDALNILYEDNHLIFAYKPHMMPSQADSSGDVDMLSAVKAYVKAQYNKPGNVYIGLVHRLDRPAAGVMVFARTSKAASRLAKQMREHKIKKIYRALVHGHPGSGTFEDYLLKDRDTNTVNVHEAGKYAKLEYKTLKTHGDLSLVEIQLFTGRSHQIRVQFASRGFALVGDAKYGHGEGDYLELESHSIGLYHPVTGDFLVVTAQ